jgi:hypothetical protein
VYMSAIQTNPYATLPPLGLGCLDCGGTCQGLGIFDSGPDYSQWGWKEYAAIAGGVYLLSSVLFTTTRGVRYAAGSGERRRKARVARISKQLEDARRR